MESGTVSELSLCLSRKFTTVSSTAKRFQKFALESEKQRLWPASVAGQSLNSS